MIVSSLHSHRAVQTIAKTVFADLAPTIAADDTERTIVERAVTLLAQHGITETWYYDCPAFVLLGSRSCLSISGREYVPSDEMVGPHNLVTIDLSPFRDGIWGDCARSFFIENGQCVPSPSDAAFARGLEVQQALHEAMLAFVSPNTSFAALFQFANTAIQRMGFENLDFLGNVGHSIESVRAARRYIEAGNTQLLGDVGFFTFEPHIRTPGMCWGFKHENIYYFSEDGRAREL